MISSESKNQAVNDNTVPPTSGTDLEQEANAQKTPGVASDAPSPAPKQLAVRYDGRAKVTGSAKYAVEFKPPANPAYAFIVQSTIPSGSITSIELDATSHASGVLAVITPFNAPRLPVASPQPPARRHITVLQEKDVFYNGQPVAVVVATSLPEAMHAATLLKITYNQTPPKLNFKDLLAQARPQKQPGREPGTQTRGDLAAAMSKASVKIDETYTTPFQHHNPMEPHATLAWWEGDKLNVYDSTQYITGDKQTLARTLGIPVDNVHLQCPYTGGGFGCKGSTWSHVVLAAMAAKLVQKPVKLALERPQMWGPVGGRPATVQRIQLAATADGKLTAISHDVVCHTSVMEDFLEPSANQSGMLYASDACETSHKLVDMNLGVATFMRAPGESSGTAALEIAMDELAEKLQVDPVQLRLINYADKDLGSDKPWSSKNLRDCYKQAAERFGWSKRSPKPQQTVQGDNLIGYGMATATYPANRSAAQAVVRILANGHAFVGCGSQDLGTGTYTIMAQTAANALGLDISKDPTLVEAKLGDSTLPKAPVSGGSQSSASILPAIEEAALQAKLKLVQLAIADPKSPLHDAKVVDIAAKDGKLFLKSSPDKSDSFSDIVTRAGGNPIEGMGSAEPSEGQTAMSTHSWGAVFAEVAVDRFTYMPRVRRVVGTYDIGTLLNRTTGLNQLVGGIVWGISFALFEESHLDNHYGRYVNNNLGEYHVPVNRDIPQIDVSVLDIPDTKFNPLGSRGIGEIGITGAAAAVANAIYNATGKRIRSYPITPDKIMRA
jgi:xanthine dehydrogenase YagR molybdenum-binding subunit